MNVANAAKKTRLAPVPDATTQRLILGTDVSFENSDRELVEDATCIPKNGTIHASFLRPDGTQVTYFGATNESLIRKIILAHAALLGAVLDTPEPSLEPTPTSTRSKRRSSEPVAEPIATPAPLIAVAESEGDEDEEEEGLVFESEGDEDEDEEDEDEDEDFSEDD